MITLKNAALLGIGTLLSYQLAMAEDASNNIACLAYAGGEPIALAATADGGDAAAFENDLMIAHVNFVQSDAMPTRTGLRFVLKNKATGATAWTSGAASKSAPYTLGIAVVKRDGTEQSVEVTCGLK